ncbi:MAG: [FeFe] hydrogenase H-cluster radical SAM maturase HydE [Nanoarchaeota archaeon]|nr:[FeFe] hydrogenase H-cluster radical SAM maturase HydE [Nanoarchaeota archaeon]
MEKGISISREEIIKLLKCREKEQQGLFHKAAQIRNENVTKNVYFRGLIEFSNRCCNDCLYCGIRRSNNKLLHYTMTKNEILDAVDFSSRAGYASVVLQSGEIRTKEFISFVEDVVKKIKTKYPDMAITLCVGEQDKETYTKFFNAGAERYLLRIETSNKVLYKKLHPSEMSFENRKQCLVDLKVISYQVGTGVMIGLPGQTIVDLADDILFIEKMGIDMVGMGPYIPHKDTPLGDYAVDKEDNMQTGLNMISVLRIVMPQINIAATTALQALDPLGREKGLSAGANVIMPNVTPQKYRESYQLYDGKPCVNEKSEDCLNCISGRIRSVGLNPAYNEIGTSLFYKQRVKNGC